MDTAALVEEIEARVESIPVRDTQALRALRREYSKRIAAVPAGDVVKIASALIVHRRVPRFIGDELIASRADALGTIDRSQLKHLGSGMSSWDQVIALHAISPVRRGATVKSRTKPWWSGPVEESLVATSRAGQYSAVEREGQRWSRRCAAHAFDGQSPY
jgi:hypothetical protein